MDAYTLLSCSIILYIATLRQMPPVLPNGFPNQLYSDVQLVSNSAFEVPAVFVNLILTLTSL